MRLRCNDSGKEARKENAKKLMRAAIELRPEYAVILWYRGQGSHPRATRLKFHLIIVDKEAVRDNMTKRAWRCSG